MSWMGGEEKNYSWGGLGKPSERRKTNKRWQSQEEGKKGRLLEGHLQEWEGHESSLGLNTKVGTLAGKGSPSL